MAEEKRTVVVYTNWITTYEKLSDEEAGKLAKHLFRYVNDLDLDPPDRLTELIFTHYKDHLDESMRKSRTGRFHWNWKNGSSSKNKCIRNSTDTKEWRGNVFKRDGWTCQSCGKKGGSLHAHHIKPFASFPKLRFNIDNGLTLCRECHIEIHKKK